MGWFNRKPRVPNIHNYIDVAAHEEQQWQKYYEALPSRMAQVDAALGHYRMEEYPHLNVVLLIDMRNMLADRLARDLGWANRNLVANGIDISNSSYSDEQKYDGARLAALDAAIGP
jgi:phosphodiesterase/alkaline phosphatase D-like protein